MNTKLLLVSMQAVSECFGNRFPDDWFSFTDEDKIYWVKNNLSEAFEGMEPDDMLDLVQAHAEVTIVPMIKGVLNSVKEKLVDAAIECELPSDFNDLDLLTMAGVFDEA